MSWEPVATALSVLALIANALVVAALVGFLASRVSTRMRGGWEATRDGLAPYALPGAFVVAAVATCGSLYFQFGAGFTPCDLCWFQRICMYPQTLVLAATAVRRDLASARWISMPLAGVGALIAAYHFQLQRNPGEPHPSCGVGQPVCSQAPFEIFGFIAIPYMALSAFLLIITLLAIAREPAELEEGEVDEAPEVEPASTPGPSPRPALTR